MPTLTIHVQDENGAPLAGASVLAEGPAISRHVPSGDDGRAMIALPVSRPAYLSVRVRKDGFVPKLITWNLDQPSFNLPGDFTLKMEKVHTIGGVVRNDAGQPVAGAQVVLIIRGSSMGGMAQQVFNDIWEQRVTTDPAGRWHFDEAPADLRSLLVTLEHPDYVSDEEIYPLPPDDDFRQQKAVLIAHKGVAVDGIVTDEKGKPVAGVDVTFGEAGSDSTTSPGTRTDDAGHFHFGALSIARRSMLAPVLTFISDDYAPEMVELRAPIGSRNLQVRLTPGSPLRVWLTDRQGQPLKNATLVADGWRGHRPFINLHFQSDRDGMIVWDHAPEDPITYVLLADSHQTQKIILQPKDEVQAVQIKSPTVVTGRVVDATTKQPVTHYDLIFGVYYPEKHPWASGWARGAALHLETDSYRYVFDDEARLDDGDGSGPGTEGFHRLRIEAPGYEPGVSRPIANDEASVTIDFQLKPAPTIHGVITAADDTPVQGAQVAVAGPGNALSIAEGFCRDRWSHQIVTTNEKGEYDLPAQEEDFPVAIIQPDAGYFTTTYHALKAAPNVKLLPWGELDIATSVKKDAGPQYFVRYLDEDKASSQKKRIRFQTYKPTESRDGLEIYKHLVAGAVRIGQYGQANNEGDVVQIQGGATRHFDGKTGAPAVVTAKAAPAGNTPAIPTATLVVHVINKDGRPIPGATVQPVGLRSKEEPSTGYGWGRQNVPGVQTGTTDAHGNATITFPVHPMDNLTTGMVIVLVQHPDACSAQVELNVDAPRPVTLVRGTKLSFRIEPVPGVLFSRIYADVAGDRQRADFLTWHSPDGQIVSAHFPDGNYLARMVAITAQGTLYFSNSSMFSPPDYPKFSLDQKTLDRMIQERPPIVVTGPWTVFAVTEGRTVHGRLDPSVPRPVKGGWAVANVTSPALIPSSCATLTNNWRASTDVAEDGSFTFADLPQGTLEIMAGCEGYVAKDTSAQPLAGGSIRRAQVITGNLDPPVTIAMEPTGAARITIQTPDGKPLAGALVYFNPNQSLGRSTSILGTRFNSIDLLRNRDDASDDRAAKIRPAIPQFSAETDGNGIALVKGLPAGQQTFYVESKSYDMPIQTDLPLSRPGEIWIPRRSGTITVSANAEASALVKMEPKGSSSLSTAVQAASEESDLSR